ncbi:hypothetical protein HBH64_151750 [Parastagonospora nodorum]|nr:hypothetical protein HBH51_117890 [Parastagonospora nodorum]KAH4053510.1 hypothetical protein HBH49_084720 [Parastagonospora nodorum]KAH4067362.1 hypothetical protein HBH50_139110 [Parastagonospora nodorum]KAH4084987.1 hypothetical protein HBH48_154840 [Parastagonospora nodorum]KAH4176376.1 hypothetical protein HBH43_057480 [Parastagonospora nodorum]
MLLTSSFFSMPPQQQYHSPYTPPRSSPLSERSANVAPRLFDFSMASQWNDKKSPTPQRAYKANPVIQTRDAATKRRRDMFFKRVQNGREDKKWEARGEQIQQLDFVSERKRWEAEKARQAPKEDDNMVEQIIEDAPLPDWTSPLPQSTHEMIEADYIAAQEEYELQQMIAAMEEQDQENDAASQHFGSDDEDYDQLFMDCAVDQQYQHSSQQMGASFQDTGAMDMDMTDG